MQIFKIKCRSGLLIQLILKDGRAVLFKFTHNFGKFTAERLHFVGALRWKTRFPRTCFRFRVEWTVFATLPNQNSDDIMSWRKRVFYYLIDLIITFTLVTFLNLFNQNIELQRYFLTWKYWCYIKGSKQATILFCELLKIPAVFSRRTIPVYV